MIDLVSFMLWKCQFGGNTKMSKSFWSRINIFTIFSFLFDVLDQNHKKNIQTRRKKMYMQFQKDFDLIVEWLRGRQRWTHKLLKQEVWLRPFWNCCLTDSSVLLSGVIRVVGFLFVWKLISTIINFSKMMSTSKRCQPNPKDWNSESSFCEFKSWWIRD